MILSEAWSWQIDCINGNLQFPYIMLKSIMIHRQYYLKTMTWSLGESGKLLA